MTYFSRLLSDLVRWQFKVCSQERTLESEALTLWSRSGCGKEKVSGLFPFRPVLALEVPSLSCPLTSGRLGISHLYSGLSSFAAAAPAGSNISASEICQRDRMSSFLSIVRT